MTSRLSEPVHLSAGQRTSEVQYGDIETRLQYQHEHPLNVLIDSTMLGWTVSTVKKRFLEWNGPSHVREVPEHLELVIVTAMRGDDESASERVEEGKSGRSEELVMEDSAVLCQYYHELCRGRMVKMRKRRHTRLNDLIYYQRRATEILPGIKDMFLILLLITLICVMYSLFGIFQGADNSFHYDL